MAWREYYRGPKLPKILIVSRNGNERFIDAKSGSTLMQSMRDAGVDELLALCGGCLSCATCHVRIPQQSQFGLTPMHGDENDLLDSSDHRDKNSRLSCQIVVTDLMERMCVAIAPEN
jgi:2Fe-2S ferredoxin